MAVVLCLCLGAVIIGVGIFAAASGGMPGMSIISKKFSDGKQSEPALLPEESQSEINSVPEGEDIVIEPNGTDGSNNTSSENPVPAEPIAFAAPERMMAVTLTAGKDYYTKQEMSTEDIQSSIESAIKKAKDLSANTVFLETSYDGGARFCILLHQPLSSSQLNRFQGYCSGGGWVTSIRSPVMGWISANRQDHRAVEQFASLLP